MQLHKGWLNFEGFWSVEGKEVTILLYSESSWRVSKWWQQGTVNTPKYDF